MTTNNSNAIANILLVIVTLLAACGWLFSKYTLAVMTPLLFLSIRFILAGMIVGVVDIKAICQLSTKNVVNIIITGALLGVQTSLWGIGLYYAEHLGIGAFLISLSFLLIPVIGMLFGLPVQKSTWFALAIATIGLLLLCIRDGFHWQLSDGYFLMSTLLYAFYFNLNGRLSAHIPAIPLTACQLIVAGAVCFLGYWFFESDIAFSLDAIYPVLAWLLASIFIATSLRFFILVKALSMAPKAQGALIMILEPVWVTLLGMIFFGEQLSSQEILGMGFISLALLVNTGVFIRFIKLSAKAKYS
ncbi:MAG: DMT family transporter [Colwellia sp.]|nr:DMT family transporter [Colwellia sp.]